MMRSKDKGLGKSFAESILPGWRGRKLPKEAQELVEEALLDQGLADAGADDPRWVDLYEEIRRRIDQPASSTAGTRLDNEGSDNEDLPYEWAPSSPTRTPPPTQSSPAPNADRESHIHSLFPQPDLTQAVHRYISASLTNKKGSLPPDLVEAESWDPSSLVAMSVLVEEIAKSQARFNAQRTMFAKSPRNQALAAKRRQKGKCSSKEPDLEPEQGEERV